ncbi:NAD(P)-dependent dehydrogenase (short-subunit alcohol dehydrogenase family) [Mycobacterium sp. URHB0021]
MSRVSVITGGAGGMGLATAGIVGRDHTVVLCDVRQERLHIAAATLEDVGITPTIVNCDVTDRQAVVRLLETAAGLGPVASVIHPAGVSPSMGDAEYVMRTNALVTLNVNEAFTQAAG